MNAPVKPLKRSIAVVILQGDRVLSTRRSSDDDELPGVWGLPAGSFRPGESTDDLIDRIGREKLGVKLIPLGKRIEGEQDRPAYTLRMELWEASMKGEPKHPEWRWSSWDDLESGAAAGSLCCNLGLKLKSRIGS